MPQKCTVNIELMKLIAPLVPPYVTEKPLFSIYWRRDNYWSTHYAAPLKASWPSASASTNNYCIWYFIRSYWSRGYMVFSDCIVSDFVWSYSSIGYFRNIYSSVSYFGASYSSVCNCSCAIAYGSNISRVIWVGIRSSWSGNITCSYIARIII